MTEQITIVFLTWHREMKAMSHQWRGLIRVTYALAIAATVLFQVSTAYAQTPDFTEILHSRGLPFAFGLAFVGGILLSLTPCVYPMIPITVAVFGAKGATRLRGFGLSLFYVLGITTTYTGLGVWAALSGQLFGSLLASPWVLASFAVLFTLLGLHLLDLLPQVDLWLSRPMAWASRFGGAGFGGAFAMGLVAGVVFAPCVGPVLVGILAYVATTRNVALGGSLLFVLALGMGVLFLILGTFSGSLMRLPRSDALMKGVKLVLSALVFVGAFYFCSLVVPTTVFRAILGAGLILFALRLGFPFHLRERASAGHRVAQATALLLILAGGELAVSAVWNGNRTTTQAGIAWRSDYEMALSDARTGEKPVLIDFTADWCLACKELERFTFQDARVIQEAQRFVPIRVDATRIEGEVENILRRHRVLGLPAVVFVDSEGRTLDEPRINEFLEADVFLRRMAQVR
jgi:thiol:disulfide interchange protein DsbD